MLDIIFDSTFFYSVIRISTPIIFAALGALITNKAGVINIGLEGIMLFSALTAVIVSAYTQSALIGLLAAIVVGVLISLLMSYVALVLKSDITLTGIAINMLGSGGTVFLLYLFANDKGISSSLMSKTLPRVSIPILKDIPFLGGVLSNHNILTYVALLAAFFVYILINKSRIGLRIRAVGEAPKSAMSVGIKPVRYQIIAMLISGVLAGFAGAYMSMGYVSWFSRDMIAGRGFIALAAQQLGRGTTLGTVVSSLVFGSADALANTMQSFQVPSEVVQSIPYLVTIIGLVIFSIRKNKEQNKQTAIIKNERRV